MNIYLFELKRQFKSTLIFSAVMLTLLFVFMGAIYPVFQESLEDVLNILSGFPPEFSAAFGLDITSMFNASGFYGFLFVYVGLIGAIMSASVSLRLFSEEKMSRCTDFLFSKPISRKRIFMGKLFAGITSLFIANVFYIVLSLAILGKNGVTGREAILASLSLLLTQIVFFAFGILYAVLAKKIRSVSSVATCFGIGAFILSALVNILKEESIRYIAPLKYFDPIDVFLSGSFNLSYALTGCFITFICLVVSYVFYTKQDSQAV